ncbi:hypothetical protein [Parathalassolituus penaei]|uniref:Porin n=1 Tax=Parathalassolituus penaei TaxID=2997323 RepID=A0A9X3ITB9_9GAMM|nr:hypothetical protein [Parathalassolituus penaei]MCY0967327.1 hypothetical protein [Parathalassolituus penaei]
MSVSSCSRRGICSFVACTSLGLLPLPLWAHGSQPAQPGLSAGLDLAVSWRSANQQSASDRANQVVWQIPGVMMGGHASAYTQGVALDETSLRLNYRTLEQAYASIKVGSHGGSELSLENAFLGQSWQWQDVPVSAEAGQMTAFFSPYNHMHPSTDAFSLAPLGYTALLGGHVQEAGVRLMAGDTAEGFSSGVETYQGSAYPAAGSGGLHTLFVRYAGESDVLDWQIQGWGLNAHANNRQDDRSASSSHSHSGTSSTAFSGYFDGDSRASGLLLGLGWLMADGQRLELRSEYLQMALSGSVRDSGATRQIEVQGDYRSWLLEPRFSWGEHSVAGRFERLMLDNTLTGSAVASLGEEAGLINDGHNPQRLSLAWNWQYNHSTGLRLEWMKDQANPERQPTVLTLGLIWRSPLL